MCYRRPQSRANERMRSEVKQDGVIQDLRGLSTNSGFYPE